MKEEFGTYDVGDSQPNEPPKFIYAKDQNALITLVQSTTEARDIQALWLSVLIGLPKQDFEELPKPKKKLIDLINREWQLVIQWLLYPPRLRNTAYPFNLPKVREYVKHRKTWFDWQASTLNLCAAVRASSPNIRHNPRYFSEFALYGGCVFEYRMAQIEGVRAGIEETITNECKENFKALTEYENWLKNRKINNPKKIEIWWGETLREVLVAAGDLNSSDAPIKDWLKKARAHYRFKRRTKGLRRICANEDETYCLDRRHKQIIYI
jgi:hypothetical protein